MRHKTKFYFYILFSAPGIIIHEFSHKLFCSLSGVKVFRVKYFQIKNPAGYVEHAQPKSFIQAFFISVGPFIFGTILSFGLFLFLAHQIKSANIYYLISNIGYWILDIISLWFAISIAINSFPSSGDAKVLLLEANRRVLHHFNLFAIILYPFVFIIKIANYLKRFYFDWIYAIFILGIAVYIVVFLIK